MCQSVSLSVCLSVRPSVFVFLSLSFFLSVSLSLSVCLFQFLSISLSLSLSVSVSLLSQSILSSCLSVYTQSPTLRSTSDDITHSYARWKLKGLSYRPFSVQKLPLYGTTSLLTSNTTVLSHSSKRVLNIFFVLVHSVLL